MSKTPRVGRYRCNWPIKFDGRKRRAGEEVQIDDASHLVASGAVSPVDGAEADVPPGDAILLGSDILPADVEIAEGQTVQLGDVVRRTHEESGLSVEDWNKLEDENREARLQAAVDAMKAEAEKEAKESERRRDEAKKAVAKKAEAKKGAAKKAEAKKPATAQTPDT